MMNPIEESIHETSMNSSSCINDFHAPGIAWTTVWNKMVLFAWFTLLATPILVWVFGDAVSSIQRVFRWMIISVSFFVALISAIAQIRILVARRNMGKTATSNSLNELD